MLTIASHALPEMWQRGWQMLSPLVQRLIGAAATAICGLAATGFLGLVIMYGDIRELKAEIRAERLMVEQSLAAIRADVMLMHGRMTEHQRNHTGRDE